MHAHTAKQLTLPVFLAHIRSRSAFSSVTFYFQLVTNSKCDDFMSLTARTLSTVKKKFSCRFH